MQKVTIEVSQEMANQIWESAVHFCDGCGVWMLEDEGLSYTAMEEEAEYILTFCSEECADTFEHPTKIYLVKETD